MNICLIRPSALINTDAFAMNPSPPLGLAFIAGTLKEAGYNVTAIDAIGESPKQINKGEFTPNSSNKEIVDKLGTNGLSTDEIISRIPKNTQVIGFSCMFSNNWLADRHLIDAVGKHFPEALIIAGGESITAKPDLWISQCREIDFCVLGEGEETILDLLTAIKENKAFNNVAGIAFFDESENKVIKTGKRTRVKDIDTIPMPAWDYFPLDNYEEHKVQWGITSRKSLPLLATRGCPYSCTFCSSPQMWGTRYYMRSPKHVADEIEFLINKYGIGNFDFYDLTAIIKRDWIIEFAKEILDRKLDITWQIPAGTRSEAIDAEVAHYLYLSGCTDICYAPESGSPKMLKLIKKKVNLSNMLDSMSYANKENMHIFINTIFALPGETHRDVWKTMWFLVQCSWAGVHELGTAMFHPYPGSALFEQMIEEKKIDLSTDDFFVNTVTISPFSKCHYHFNDHISANWYRFYLLFALVLFYSTNYIFRPQRLFVMIRNVITQRYATRTERALGKLIIRKLSELKTFLFPQGDTKVIKGELN